MVRYFSLTVFCLAAVAFLGAQASNADNAKLQEIIERHLKHIDTNRQTLSLLKELIQGMDDEMQQVRKRTCYFNAGMSHSCDYKEVIGAVDEANYWSSEMSPGRRKRFSSQFYPYLSRPASTSANYMPPQTTRSFQPAENDPQIKTLPSSTEINPEALEAFISQSARKSELQDAYELVPAERAPKSPEESPEQTL